MTKILHLEPTTVCNLSCPQCGRTNGDLPNSDLRSAELSLSDIQQIVPDEFIQNLDKMFMCGNYGEPAAARDCLAIFRHFKTVNPNITLGLNTNGSLRSPQWWSELASIMSGPLDYVVWSIDGLEDTNHIYRRNSQWSKIMANATAFIGAGGSAHWDMLVFEHNKHQVTTALEQAKNMGFTWFRSKETFRPVHSTVSWLRTLPGAAPPVTGRIECEYKKSSTIYLSAHGEWLPCCYIASLTDNFGDNEIKPLFRSNPDLKRFESATVSAAFAAVEASWESTQPLDICARSCSVNSDGVTRAKSKWKNEVQLR